MPAKHKGSSVDIIMWAAELFHVSLAVHLLVRLITFVVVVVVVVSAPPPTHTHTFARMSVPV